MFAIYWEESRVTTGIKVALLMGPKVSHGRSLSTEELRNIFESDTHFSQHYLLHAYGIKPKGLVVYYNWSNVIAFSESVGG